MTNSDTYAELARLGFGLMQAPRYRYAEDLAKGTLVEVLPDYPPTPMPISALYPRSRQLSPRVRVFIDWLVEIVAPNLWKARIHHGNAGAYSIFLYRTNPDFISGDLVVELHRDGIRLVRQPIDTTCAFFARLRINGFDQCATDAEPARFFDGEEILQIAVRPVRPSRAVEDAMHDAQDAAVMFGDERMHGFGGIEEACESLFSYRRGNVRLVEDLIALPQRFPAGAVARFDGTDMKGRRPRANRGLPRYQW